MRIRTSAAILGQRDADPLLVADDPHRPPREEPAMRKSFNESMKKARGRYGAPRMHC